tara:strand:- start:157 stop:588 length:432 start_codon:yes stop_codon:yes gene_type:complete
MSQRPFEQIDIRFEFTIGLILVLNTLSFGVGFAGPWEDVDFTRGVLGLVGLVLLYRAWYARTFGFYGLIPALHLWVKPDQSIPRILLVAVAILMSSWLIGNSMLQPLFAEPTSLILTVLGMLMLLMAIYARLVFVSGLSDEEE